MLRILVTGASGQLGRSIAALAENYPFLFIYADVGELDLSKPIDEITAFIEAIPHLPQDSLAKNEKDRLLIINCAAYTAVDKAEGDEGRAEEINTKSIHKLADILQTRLETGIMHISTDYVFDGMRHTPYEEDDEANPQSVYGRTKYGGEQALQNIAKDGRALVVRTAWLYSPYGNNFAKTMLRLSTERPLLGIVSDQIGSPTYAPHLAKTLLDIALCFDKEGRFRTPCLHITDAGVASWYDLGHYIIRHSDQKGCEVRPICTSEYPTPAPRPPYSVLSKQRLANLYGIYPPHWTVGVEHFLEEVRNV